MKADGNEGVAYHHLCHTHDAWLSGMQGGCFVREMCCTSRGEFRAGSFVCLKAMLGEMQLATRQVCGLACCLVAATHAAHALYFL